MESGRRSQVVLTSSDEKCSVNIDWKVAMQSDMICVLLRSSYQEGTTRKIKFPSINTDVLMVIIDYLKYLYKEKLCHQPFVERNSINNQIEDRKLFSYFEVPVEISLEVLMAADFLQLNPLIDLSCITVAKHLSLLKNFGGGIPVFYLLKIMGNIDVESLFRIEFGSILDDTIKYEQEIQNKIDSLWKHHSCVIDQKLLSLDPPIKANSKRNRFYYRSIVLQNYLENCVHEISTGSYSEALTPPKGELFDLIKKFKCMGPYVRNFNLRNSILEPKLFSMVVWCLTPFVSRLNVAENNIGRISGCILAKAIRNSKRSLCSLNLENTCIKGETLRTLLGNIVGKRITNQQKKTTELCATKSSCSCSTTTSSYKSPSNFTIPNYDGNQNQGGKHHIYPNHLTIDACFTLNSFPENGKRNIVSAALMRPPNHKKKQNLSPAGSHRIVRIEHGDNYNKISSLLNRKMDKLPLNQVIQHISPPGEIFIRKSSSTVRRESSRKQSGAAKKSKTNNRETISIKNNEDNEKPQSNPNNMMKAIDLNISNNPIGDVAMIAISDSFLNLQGPPNTMISLNFSRNNIGEIGGMCIAETLKNLKNLKYLFMAECNVGDIALRAILSTLIGNTTNHYLIDKAHTSTIDSIILKKPLLQDHVLSSSTANQQVHYKKYTNDSKPQHREITQGYKIKGSPFSTKLLTLDIRGNTYERSTILDGLGSLSHHIGKMLVVNKTLTNLKLGNNYIDTDGYSIIANALKLNDTLLELDLSKIFEVSTCGISQMIDIMSMNIRNQLVGYQLTTLDLSNNNLPSTFIISVSKLIRYTGNLCHLNISGNKMDSSSATHLGSVLSRNTSLRTLNLAVSLEKGNGINCEGAVELFHHLQNNYTLMELILSGHRIRNTGAIAVANFIRHQLQTQSQNKFPGGGNPEIGLFIDLRKNQINLKGAISISEATGVGIKSLYRSKSAKDNSCRTDSRSHKFRVDLSYNPIEKSENNTSS